MHLDLVESKPNSYKMIAENVNTHAHGDVHLVVLAHLRRRWSLSGRDGFGTLPPAKLARQDSVNFQKCSSLFLVHRTLAPTFNQLCSAAPGQFWSSTRPVQKRE
jgi:hypothetical protein